MPAEAEATAQVFDLLLGENAQGRKEHIAENGYKYLGAALLAASRSAMEPATLKATSEESTS